MKTLNNHLILFDAECPMCSVYTKAFVATGILPADGRISYQQLTENACPMVDRQRAVDEIALVNKTTGEVNYGISSLFKVFGTAMPILKPLFSFSPFIWIMRKIYAFISYNRRVIIPATGAKHSFNFQPSFKLNYRVVYLVFTWSITAYILTAYVPLMKGLLPPGFSFREYLVCGGQLFFQGAIITLIAKEKTWDYLGNMMTISFGGALLLFPVLLLSPLLHAAALFYVLYFMGVAGCMLLEHARRSKILNIGWVLSISWVVYRLLVLVLIFLAN